MGIGPGDEVITSAYIYTASCSPIIHVVATPVLVDVTPDSFLQDYEAIGRAITNKTKVKISVDICRVICNYYLLNQVLEEKKALYTPSSPVQAAFDRVIILADSAHAIGATYNRKKAGEVADFTAFSLVVLKNDTSKKYTGIRVEGFWSMGCNGRKQD